MQMIWTFAVVLAAFWNQTLKQSVLGFEEEVQVYNEETVLLRLYESDFIKYEP